MIKSEEEKLRIAAENREGIERIVEVADGIYQVIYPNIRTLGRAMFRFQEFYESPEFQGKTFSSKEFIQWYLANSEGGKEKKKFTYYEDWGGYNLPSAVLEPFYNGEFGSCRRGEQELLDTFESKRGKKFYILGTSRESSAELEKHELAHALFGVNDEYQRQVLQVLAEERRLRNPALDRLETYLSEMEGGVGYAPDKIPDEEQAYLIAYDDITADGLDCPDMRRMHDKLVPIFDRFFIPKRQQAA